MQLNQVSVPGFDIAASVQFYIGLGLKLIVSSPHYARFECPNLDSKVAELRAIGYSFISGPRDEPWLWREASLQDPARNEVCLYWAGENRRHPPWRVKS
jgi:catechol 2,3-dioxygenase-like lactoylglutathione lyase family enzyme